MGFGCFLGVCLFGHDVWIAFWGVVSGVISPLWVGVWLYVGVDLLGFLIALLGWFVLLIWYW